MIKYRRAISKELYDSKTICRVHQLLCIYKEIPLTHFNLLYYKHFHEIFDPMPRGFTNGLVGYLNSLKSMIEVVGYTNTVPIYALRINPNHHLLGPKSDHTVESRTGKILKIIRNRSRISVKKELLDTATPMWSDFKHLAHQTDLHIDLSPLQMLQLKDEQSTERYMKRFHEKLRQFPDGVRLDELYMLFPELNQIFELFGAPDVCSLTQEYFELFHVRESEGCPVPLVFDGRTRAAEDLDDKGESTRMISARSILDGLYQKTLLILSAASDEGLKLGVWHGSIKGNFGEPDLKGVKPLELLKAWRDEGLLEIRTGDIFKNDLIIDFPSRKVDPKYTHASKESLIQMVGE